MIAYLGLGSNLGDRRSNLAAGLRALAELGPMQVSPLYETAPVGGPAGQPPYLNLVARLETGLTPHQLLDEAMAIERAAHRERTVRHGPRTLDVDVLLLRDEGGGEIVLDEPDLVVPHPRMTERAFVLAPLEDLDPAAVPAGWRRELGGEAAVEEMARRVAES